jgi:hemin uptake protein HemP
MAMQSPHVSAVVQNLRSATDAATISVVSNANAEDVIASNALLGQKGVCIIVHNAEQYILRRTRNNKLILTK